MKYFILLLLITSIYADSDKHRNERHINKELSHLDFSKTQKKKIKHILKEFRHDLKEFREYKEEIQEQREKIFIKEVLDIKELNILNQKLDAAAHEIENKLLEKIHSILSQKQRKKFIHYFDDWEVK
ncbi:MAG: protein CpxP [Sulfurimonas sp.]|jgi:protein CpxP